MQADTAVRVEGLNALLRSLNRMPPQVGQELKNASWHIANNIMLPEYQRAAQTVPSWGGVLSKSIRVKRDRVPALKIGYQEKVTSGSRHGWKGSKRSRHYSSKQGASTNMLRWPTFSGDKGSSFAPFTKTSWIHRAGGYKPKAMEAWGDALTRYVRKWNAGAVS